MQSKNKLKSFLLAALIASYVNHGAFLSDWGVNGKHIGAPYMQAIFTLYFVMTESLSRLHARELRARMNYVVVVFI